MWTFIALYFCSKENVICLGHADLFYGHEKLKNDRPLYDVVFPGILVVAYPDDGITTRGRKVSIDLDLEPDFFSFLDSE